jgi:hypothetical protein
VFVVGGNPEMIDRILRQKIQKITSQLVKIEKENRENPKSQTLGSGVIPQPLRAARPGAT